MRKSRLPQGGENIFQKIKRISAEAEAKGVKIYRLSIGQPKGPAIESARKAASLAILSDEERMHEYQDNGSPGCPDFAKKFVQAHISSVSLDGADVAYLPIPGIKPMLPQVIMACGKNVIVAGMTRPGYPVPETWANYLDQIYIPLSTNPDNYFLCHSDELSSGSVDLVMCNYPHNPSGQIATREFWENFCEICVETNTRLFNDAAYAMLAHSPKACTLAEVAIKFPLSWAEAYSASKVIGNGTGWRIAAMVGSPDFIGDIATIKGNTDSGFNAALANGVLTAVEKDKATIDSIRETYAARLSWLNTVLGSYGMKLAVEPSAGFFSLFMVPRKAFGQSIKDAEQFNTLMIQNTGIVGVHFREYIRYSVTAPLENIEWQETIHEGFKKANVSY